MKPKTSFLSRCSADMGDSRVHFSKICEFFIPFDNLKTPSLVLLNISFQVRLKLGAEWCQISLFDEDREEAKNGRRALPECALSEILWLLSTIIMEKEKDEGWSRDSDCYKTRHVPPVGYALSWLATARRRNRRDANK
jgi:hypothetical protein